MEFAPWWYAVLALALAAHFLVLGALFRRSRDRSAEESTEATGSRIGGARQCPHCGEGNRPEFQFCRQCVGPLDGSGTPPDHDAGAAGGPA